ncbi:MAG: helix-turn-helix transcriptional regulator [Coprococcus sp.]|nr:helix-turn-helix transcriptional regulator [Coprococcus sp.]
MFNENFKILRKDRGFSQVQMAARLNVVRQTISKWEEIIH